MKYRRSISESEEISEINVSPLIDMVFILLIFFIVTTVFVEETGIEVQRPEAATGVRLERESILFEVDPDVWPPPGVSYAIAVCCFGFLFHPALRVKFLPFSSSSLDVVMEGAVCNGT